MSHKLETQNGDLRVKRTQMMLQQAFMDLVIEVGFSAITIQMLADRAMINRATFYRHYEDIYDLVEKVYINLINEYLESVKAVMPGNPVATLTCIFEHCGTYAPFYLALLSELPRFQELVRDTGEQQLETFFMSLGADESKMTMPRPIIFRYWMSAQMGLVQWWLETGQEIPAEQMAQHLWQMLEQGAVKQLQLP